MATTFGKLSKQTPNQLSTFDYYLKEKKERVYSFSQLRKIESKSYSGGHYDLFTGPIKIKDKDYKTVDISVKFSQEDNGKYISFEVFNFIDNKKIMESPHLQKVLLYLMESNGNTKIGRWVINQNCELSIDCRIAANTDDITFNQLASILEALVSTLRDSYCEIQRILELGIKYSITKEDLIKNIIYELTKHNKLDLIPLTPKLLEEQDLKKVCSIHQLILDGDFEEASKILKPENKRNKIVEYLFGP